MKRGRRVEILGKACFWKEEEGGYNRETFGKGRIREGENKRLAGKEKKNAR